VKVFLKIFIVALIFSSLSIQVCTAKTIRDTSGRFSFETSDTWQLHKLGADSSSNIELISIKLDDNTFVMFNQAKVQVPYEKFSLMNTSDKTALKNALVEYHVNDSKKKGYNLTVNKEEIYNDGIFLGFILENKGTKYALAEMYFVKNYKMYSLYISGTEHTIKESSNTALTLKIDGVKFSDWFKS